MFNLQFVSILGKKIAYKSFNNAAKNEGCLVFLHDALGSIAQWRDFPEQLGKRLDMRVVVYERHAYGASEILHEQRKTDYLQYEGEVILKAFLDAISVKQNVVLVGHSDGGSIALVFAALFPNYVKAVVAEAAHVFVESVTIKGIEDTVALARKTPLIERLSKYHGSRTQFIFNAWSHNWLSSAYWHWNIESYLPKITAPLLVIQGEADNYGTVKQVFAIANKSAGEATVKMIPACGHAPHKEFPEQVLDAVSEWLILE